MCRMYIMVEFQVYVWYISQFRNTSYIIWLKKYFEAMDIIYGLKAVNVPKETT